MKANRDKIASVDIQLFEELYSSVEMPRASDELSAKLMSMAATASADFEAKCASEAVKIEKRKRWLFGTLVASATAALVAIVMVIFSYFNIELNILKTLSTLFSELLSPTKEVVERVPEFNISPMWVTVVVACVALVILQIIVSAKADKQDMKQMCGEGQES